MKKFLALLLVVAMVASFAACAPADNSTGSTQGTTGSTAGTTQGTTQGTTGPTDDPSVKGEGVMTYAEYAAAALDTQVTIEAYVQATQSWWDNKITVYTQDLDGGYFLYNMPCSQEDAAKLVPGTKIRITGTKAEWSGEVEIVDITKLEILEGSYIAEAQDLTSILSDFEAMLAKQNVLGAFKGMTIEAIEYKNGEPGDDIYVTVSLDGINYSFCVERYLTDPDTDVYKAFAELNPGDKVDLEGFVYWYEGPEPHITKVTVTHKETKGEGVMTYAEYAAAELGTQVTIETYVQATQSWWDNKITVYTQDRDGAYFLYNMACSQEDAAKLVPGTKIRVTGYKDAWSGEVEIVDIEGFEVLEGNYIATAKNVTDLLGNEDELLKLQNQLVSFTGLTLEKVEYKNGEPGEGNDIYVTVSLDGVEYSFCVEAYLTGPETDVYKAFETLELGNTVIIEGFLYWYEGPEPHITAIYKMGR